MYENLTNYGANLSFEQLGRKLWISALTESGSLQITVLGFKGFSCFTLLGAGLGLVLVLCSWKGSLLIMAKNQSLGSQFTHHLRSQPLLLSLTTAFCPLTPSWSTPMWLSFSTTKPSTISAVDRLTLRDPLTPTSTGLFLRYQN